MLELIGIRKTYSDATVALDGVDLVVEKGMVGLLGPNGAGKTTLLSILALALEPTSGERSYFGLRPTASLRGRIRRMVGYLPQELSPLEGLTGYEYLELCAAWRGLSLRGRGLRRRIEALLEAVELQGAARRRADRYSGGMVRRLGLAQAILHGPRILVVDEPTAGLDPEERIRFRNLITDLAEEIPVLLSTHIVEDIEATCPRLVILAHGRALCDGSPGDLMRRMSGQLVLVSDDAWKRSERDPDGHSGPRRVGRRVDSDGKAEHVVIRHRSENDIDPVVPTLEEACSAFLLSEADQQLLEQQAEDRP
ncbi:MAG: ATP-binding cassette domain-containing protein [Holophagales bacterium]|nr:ATP-binding cassette domain-containing protein [Holophagales bacterium]